jgi:hypothetical protein
MIPPEMKPPERLSLIFCPVCGKDDRYRHLPRERRHRDRDSHLCPGTPERITYTLKGTR